VIQALRKRLQIDEIFQLHCWPRPRYAADENEGGNNSIE
jgi:hypothetical protein